MMLSGIWKCDAYRLIRINSTLITLIPYFVNNGVEHISQSGKWQTTAERQIKLDNPNLENKEVNSGV